MFAARAPLVPSSAWDEQENGSCFVAQLLTLTHGVIQEGNLISRLQFDSEFSINDFSLHRYCCAASAAAGAGPGPRAAAAQALRQPFPQPGWALSPRLIKPEEYSSLSLYQIGIILQPFPSHCSLGEAPEPGRGLPIQQRPTGGSVRAGQVNWSWKKAGFGSPWLQAATTGVDLSLTSYAQ